MQKKIPSKKNLRKFWRLQTSRDLFLVGHMYIENTIDRILEKKFNIPSKSIDSTIHIKSENGYTHRIWFDQRKFEEKCRINVKN